MAQQLISEFESNRLLDYEFSDTVNLSLHTASPGDDGSNEVAGGSYERQEVDPAGWSAAADKALHNVDEILFPDMPEIEVTHAGLWDGDGNFLRAIELDPPISCTAGDTVRIAEGAAEFTIENKED